MSTQYVPRVTLILDKPLPSSIRESIEAYIGCVSGADMKGDYLHAIAAAGFRDVRIIDEARFPIRDLVSHPAPAGIPASREGLQDAAEQLAASIVSIRVSAVKT